MDEHDDLSSDANRPGRLADDEDTEGHAFKPRGADGDARSGERDAVRPKGATPLEEDVDGHATKLRP